MAGTSRAMTLGEGERLYSGEVQAVRKLKSKLEGVYQGVDSARGKRHL